MKIIHKGPVYTIGIEPGADGRMEAVKVSQDGRQRREPYYPGRDVTPLAGLLDESDVWRLMADVAKALISGAKTPVCPAHILSDGGPEFTLNPWSSSLDKAYCAPEGYEAVWALGATAFFMTLGCPVFYGYGGRLQREHTPVPAMRRSWPELSALVARCLDFKPSRRPAIQEIKDLSSRALMRLEAEQKRSRPLKPEAARSVLTHNSDGLDRLWPENFD